MGMFDYIHSEYPLPSVIIEGEKITFDSTEDFQTKDLDNVLAKFTISKDGIILDEKGKEYNYRRNLYFHGVIDFYTSKTYNGNRYWIEYHAEFTKGKLTDITPLVERLR